MAIKKVNVNIQGKVGISKYKNLAELTEEVSGYSERIEECEEKVASMEEDIVYTNDEDITVDNDKNLILADKQYDAADYSGLGRVYLRKNMIVVSLPFDGFLQTSPTIEHQSLFGVPDAIFFDVQGERFVCQKGLKYYNNWQNNEGYLANLTDGDLFSYDDEYYEYNDGALAVKENPSRTNVLTQEMLNKANTVYHIQYDFTLGEDITVPENCVLQFDGGSIDGEYTLTFQDTYIEDFAKFNVTFAGNITNELFNVLWISNGDLGAKINKAQENFKSLIVPQGDYTFTTPVVISGLKRLEMLGSLKYNGTYKNCEGIFLIERSIAIINFNELFPYNANDIDKTDTRIINTVGLEIRSCNNCHISITSVGWFNEQLRVSDLYSIGCSNNVFLIGSLNNGNANLRIYQHNSDSNNQNAVSWCNENIFIGGKMARYNSTATYGEYHNIVVGGPALDKPSYLPSGIVDTYDHCNSIMFQKINMEGNIIPVILRNTGYITLFECRMEGCPKPLKVIGTCSSMSYINNFGPDIQKIDADEGTNISLKNSTIGYKYDININNTSLRQAYRSFISYERIYMVPYKVHFLTSAKIDDKIKELGNFLVGAIVDVTNIRLLLAGLDGMGRIAIAVLNDNNENITADYQNTCLKGEYMMYSQTTNAIQLGVDSTNVMFNIPSNVTKVFVGTTISTNNNILSIYADPSKISVNNLRVKGPAADRPIGLPYNVPYFDEDLCENIYWSGDTKSGNRNGWVHEDGTIAVRREGTTAQRPIGGNGPLEIKPYENGKFKYFDTDLAEFVIATAISWAGNVTWKTLDGAVAGVKRSGVSTERPSASDIYVGFKYVDTTLNKPIYWNGTKWVDADGHTPLPKTATLNDSSAATYLRTTHADATSDDIGMGVWITDVGKMAYLSSVDVISNVKYHTWKYADGTTALDERQAPVPNV